jgi:hypothetical protein
MKTLRLFGIALLTVLMSVAFSSCSKSDDDNNGGGGSSASIEGTWYATSQTWYDWDNEKNAPDYSDSYNITDRETFIFTKTERGYRLRYIYKEKGDNKETESVYDLIQNSENDYKAGNNRIVFKSIKSNSLELEWWDSYYGKNGTTEYGVINLTK